MRAMGEVAVVSTYRCSSSLIWCSWLKVKENLFLQKVEMKNLYSHPTTTHSEKELLLGRCLIQLNHMIGT